MKTRAFVEYQGRKLDKLFVDGNIVKFEEKNGRMFLTLSHYKGANAETEFTNNILVTDQKKIDYISKLTKKTQVFCEINVIQKTYNDKVYDNLYLFAIVKGREGDGDVLIEQTSDNPFDDEEMY